MNGNQETTQMTTQIRAMKKQFEQKIESRVFEILNDLLDKQVNTAGLDRNYIARKAFGKTYVTDKEERLVYRLIKKFRDTVNNGLICQRRKYGFGQTKEEVLEYATDQLKTTCGHLAHIKRSLEANKTRLRLNYNTNLLIEEKVGEILQ